ncbi:MAG: hypothetical protein FJY80_01175 [Candidatus Aminicenantes bacterium]|nr:hypothetical protein [Candidatus Aminicenantes bacterium]
MSRDDKLESLRRARDVARRGRAGSVEEAWARIDRAGDRLSVKEKLEKLIHLTGQGPSRRPPLPPVELEPREPVRVFENAYPLEARYGKLSIADGLSIPGQVLATLSLDAEFRDLGLASSLILDLETTGLAGGTGTVPFLIGLGFYRQGRFVVAQHFLGDLGEEERFLDDFARFVREGEFRSVVTYNGKAFDLPLLETRFILHRRKFPLADLPHLDFLFAARSLWKHKHESCRLFHLAREVVQAPREEDIPSAEIPYRYFDYLRTGNFGPIEPVLYHNAEDILSLLGLVIAGASLVAGGGRPSFDETADPLDLIGLGRVLDRAGDAARSSAAMFEALRGRLPAEVARGVVEKLTVRLKRSEDWPTAVSLWEGHRQAAPLLCYRELSKYYEHRAKDFDEARRYAEEGLALAVSLDASFEKDFVRRVERLTAKAKRRTAKAKEGR